jgi:parallel beta-helix repeat protein
VTALPLPLLALLAALALPAHGAPAPCTLTVASDADIASRHEFASLRPGSTVCIAPGTYRRQLAVIGARGTAQAPIAFLVRPAGGVARFEGGLLLRSTSHVGVTGLDVSLDPRAGPDAAVIVDVGADHTAVRGLSVHDAFVGIALGSSAGPAGVGNEVADNVVRGVWNTGIGIAELSDGTAQEPNTIRRNQVLRSGGHGIDINDANFIAVRDNVVVDSGTGVNSVRQGGYSGIHVYSREASSPASAHGRRSAHNLIQGNRVEGTRERSALETCDDGSGSGVCADGNGIQVDRFASFNQVVGNTVSGNAGDGISIYGASDNLIKDNVVRGNNQQAGRRRYFPGPAEIALTAVNLPRGSTSGNTVVGNTATTTVNKVPAFYVSDNAGARNVVDPSNRWLQDPASEPGFTWGPVYVGRSWHSQRTAPAAIAELSR